MPAGLSLSKEAHDLRGQEFVPNEAPGTPTPGMANGSQDAASKAQVMAEKDPHGWILTVVAVSVVFTALAILWGLFMLLFWLLDRLEKKSAPKKEAPAGEISPDVAAAIAAALDMEEDGDVYAAIAAALDLYFADTLHDAEPFVVTIRPHASAWNDKKQTFRKLPR